MIGRGLVAAVLIITAGTVLSGCKLIKNEERVGTDGEVDIFFDDKSFDPDKMARELWDEGVIPYLDAKAGDFPEVIRLAAEDPDEAGRRFGHREKAEGNPWTMVVRLEGVIVGENLGSRAATVDVDADGDATADAKVQIGPVIRGTALRDSLDFVPFGAFTNQIDYAKFGKSLNTHLNATALQSLPRENIVGRRITLLGVFEFNLSAGPPLITPAQISVAEPSS